MISPQPVPASRTTAPSGQPEASGAAAASTAGFAYLASEAHYRLLAERVLLSLARGRGCVLVTGDPAPDLRLTCQALRQVGAGRHTVVGVASGPEILRAQLLHASSPPAISAVPSDKAEPVDVSASGAPSERPPLLFVLGDIDRLGDEQLGEICEMTMRGKRSIAGAVLLAFPAMLERLRQPALAMLREALAARLRLEHLDRTEVEPFLRSQLGVDIADNTLPPDTVNDIADAADGDPALLNGFARRVLDLKVAKRSEPALAAPQHGKAPADVDPLSEIARLLTEAEADPKPMPRAPVERFDRSALREMLDELSYAIERADRDVATPGPKIVAPADSAEPREPEEAAAATSVAPSSPAEPLPVAADAVEAIADPAPALALEEQTPSEAAAKPAASELPQAPAPLFLSVVAEGAARPAETASPHIAHPGRRSHTWRWIAALILVAVAGGALAAGGLWVQRQARNTPAVAAVAVTLPPPAQPQVAITRPEPSPPPHGEDRAEGAALPPKPAEMPADKPATVAVVPMPAPAPTSTPAAAAPTAEPITPGAVEAAKSPAATVAAPPAARVDVAASPEPQGVQHLPAQEIAELIARGDAFLGRGDIVSARLFYERAAEAGDGQAALLTGETFDPNLLARTGLRGMRGDAAKAAEWYRRAVVLGVADAETLLKALANR